MFRHHRGEVLFRRHQGEVVSPPVHQEVLFRRPRGEVVSPPVHQEVLFRHHRGEVLFRRPRGEVLFRHHQGEVLFRHHQEEVLEEHLYSQSDLGLERNHCLLQNDCQLFLYRQQDYWFHRQHHLHFLGLRRLAHHFRHLKNNASTSQEYIEYRLALPD